MVADFHQVGNIFRKFLLYKLQQISFELLIVHMLFEFIAFEDFNVPGSNGFCGKIESEDYRVFQLRRSDIFVA